MYQMFWQKKEQGIDPEHQFLETVYEKIIQMTSWGN